jgi:hypothetical protein
MSLILRPRHPPGHPGVRIFSGSRVVSACNAQRQQDALKNDPTESWYNSSCDHKDLPDEVNNYDLCINNPVIVEILQVHHNLFTKGIWQYNQCRHGYASRCALSRQ